MREIRSSGSVRGGVGNDPAYSAECVGHGSRRALRVVEAVEPGIGIGLQEAGPAGEMALRMLAADARRGDRANT